jgi:uncharacterized protein YkwD
LQWLARAVAPTLVTGWLLVSSGGPAIAANASNDRYADHLGELVNHYREQQGKPPFIVDRALAGLAREHSAAMAKAGRLSHDEFPSRVRRSGYGMCIENVGWNYPTPQAQLLAWPRSPGHDRNLLDGRVRHMGIGAASDYVTFIGCQ